MYRFEYVKQCHVAKCINYNYLLIFFSLVDSSEADAASSVNQHLRRVWVCPECNETMIVNMAEQLSHSGECELLQSIYH